MAIFSLISSTPLTLRLHYSTNGEKMSVRLTGLALLLLSSAIQAIPLTEAVRMATQRHPDSALTEARQQLESGYRRQAESLFAGDPLLNFSATGDVAGSHSGYEEYVAGIALPVWLPGQRAAKARIADQLAALAEAKHRQFIWTVAGEVLERAWALRLAESEVEQSRRQRQAAHALLEDIRRRHEAGELSRNDLLLAQQDLLDAETVHQQALNILEATRLSWASYTGLEKAPEDLEGFSGPGKDHMPEQHPRLQAALAAMNVAAALSEDAQAQQRAAPVLSLVAQRDRGSRLDDYTDALGIALSLPLGTRAAAAATIAEAEAEYSRVLAQARRVQRELQLQQAQAEQARIRAGKLLQLAEEKHRYARDRLKLARRAFELGEMDLYQLLLARGQYNQASHDLARRRLELARASARYRHLSGEIPQ